MTQTFLTQSKGLIKCFFALTFFLRVFELLGLLLLLVKLTQYPHKMENFHVQRFLSNLKEALKGVEPGTSSEM